MNKQLQQFLKNNNLTFDKYQEKVRSLLGLKNKEDFIGKDKFPISTNIYYLLHFLELEECKYWIEKYGYLIQVDHPKKSGYFFGIGGFHLICKNTTIFNDKIYTKTILGNNGFKTLNGEIIFPIGNQFRNNNFEKDLYKKTSKKDFFPVVRKPVKGSLGNGVEIISNLKKLKNNLKKYEIGTELFMIEKYIQGKEFRVFYMDGFMFGYEKIGKGIVKNISKGAHIKQYILSKKESDFIESIANLFNEKVFGLDIITNGSIDEGFILEINGNPGLKWLKLLEKHQKKTFWEKYWNLIKKENGIL